MDTNQTLLGKHQKALGRLESRTTHQQEVAMPVYEFYCEKCKKDFSLQLRLADFEKGNYQCPECKGRKLKKQISAFQTKTSRKS
jgi:putative FmdB family regulatory protein